MISSDLQGKKEYGHHRGPTTRKQLDMASTCHPLEIILFILNMI